MGELPYRSKDFSQLAGAVVFPLIACALGLIAYHITNSTLMFVLWAVSTPFLLVGLLCAYRLIVFGIPALHYSTAVIGHDFSATSQLPLSSTSMRGSPSCWLIHTVTIVRGEGPADDSVEWREQLECELQEMSDGKVRLWLKARLPSDMPPTRRKAWEERRTGWQINVRVHTSRGNNTYIFKVKIIADEPRPEEETCPICHNPPHPDALEFGDIKVCLQCKEEYAQRLREGVG